MKTKTAAERTLRLGLPAERLGELAGRCTLNDCIPVAVGQRAWRRRYLTSEDLFVLCDWRYPDYVRACRHNSESRVRQQTGLALEATDPVSAMTPLMELQGVAWGVASVILHFAHMDPYPILDFPALSAFNCEAGLPRSLAFWRCYVEACRTVSVECGLSIRELYRAFWQLAQESQASQSRRECLHSY